MWNAGLDISQAGIKIAVRNTNNLRYADDTTIMAESEEELKSLLMKVKEESKKVGLKLLSLDEMAGWHHWLDGCEFEWTPGDGDGQRSLACCNLWGHKESDMTERLNWTELIGHEMIGQDAMILVFWMLSFKPIFHSPLSLSSRGSLVLHLGP